MWGAYVIKSWFKAEAVLGSVGLVPALFEPGIYHSALFELGVGLIAQL